MNATPRFDMMFAVDFITTLQSLKHNPVDAPRWSILYYCLTLQTGPC